MSRVLSFDRAMRRITPASVLFCLFVGYVCWGAYGVFRERGRMRESKLLTSHAAASRLEHVQLTWSDVQRDFASAIFQKGDPVERLLAAHPPAMVIRHTPYTTVYYRGQSGEHDLASEVEVVAKHGRLVQAKTYLKTGPRETTEVRFFGDGWLFSSAEYLESLGAGLLRWQDDVNTAVMAVTGAAAVSRLSEPAAD